MAKPYLIFKAHNRIYYAQIRLADGSLSNNKSTGCRNRAEAECKVMEWIVTGNIPARVGSKDSIPIVDFLENFWDYDKSPYVKEKLGKKQSIHRQYCATLLSRTHLYWIYRLAGKCVAEITRKRC